MSEEIVTCVKDLAASLHSMKERVDFAVKCDSEQAGIFATAMQEDQGLSLLQAKIKAGFQYVLWLLVYSMSKLDRNQVGIDVSVENLIKLRLAFEKIFPLEKKLKYQVDKLMRAAKLESMPSASTDVSDPLLHRPDPSALAPSSQEPEEASGHLNVFDEENKVSFSENSGKYVIPKNRMVMFEEEERETRKAQKKERKMAKRMQESEMAHAIREEFSEAPVSMHVAGVGGGADEGGETFEEKELRRFEEDNFMRLNLSKSMKKRFGKKRQASQRLDQFEDYDDIAAFMKPRQSIDFDSLQEESTRRTQKTKRKKTI
jgi:hypothetical protein